MSEGPQRTTVLGKAPSSGTRTLGALFKPQFPMMLRGFLWLVLTNLSALAVPRLVNIGIDVVEGRGTSLSLGAVVALIAGLAVIGGVVRTRSRIVLFNAGRDVERSLRQELFAHLATLSSTYFGKASTGDLMSRLTNDLTNIRLLAGFALLNAANGILVVVVTLPLLFLLDARVAAVSLLPFPLVIVAAQLVSKRMFRRTRENQDAIGALSTVVQESLAGQMVVRAFSQEDAVVARFVESNDRVFNTSMKLARIRLLMGPLMGLMGSFAIAAALFSSGYAVADGRMTVGDVVELNTRLLQLTWPMIALGFTLSVWQRGKASLSRINEVLAARPDVVDGPRLRPAASLLGAIEVKGLVIEVGTPARRGVDALSVSVPAGSFLGVVGKNGSGKSLLLKAIARQLPIARDQVLIDGVDVVDWHLDALRRAPGGVAVVPEDGFLFSATLRENLVFGADQPSDVDVEAVVDLVDLRRDIERFPQGLQTVIGERGVTLSGGQRQRVALGRALLARPAILLLDDCLSAVDVETEQNIIRSLQKGFVVDGTLRCPTIVMVSHRLSALKVATAIIGLDSGKAVERGTHDELLESGGVYATLWGLQQKREELAKRLRGEVVA
ncbi:MAG: ABC transporter ATP-binding protein [Deltaproteobacteria bacterium]|nr:ABC transporter ATP-binding protein [Deltaproteobacteria bacterium]